MRTVQLVEKLSKSLQKLLCSVNLNGILFLLLQALAKFENTQKVTNKSGIEQEDALLNESAAKETSLNLHIMDLENEVKQVSVQ